MNRSTETLAKPGAAWRAVATTVLWCAALVVACPGCTWLKAKAPAVEACAPTPAALAAQVALILATGGDYEARLEALFVSDGESAIVCAVQAFLTAKSPSVGVSADDSDAKARAQAFLDKHPVGK